MDTSGAVEYNNFMTTEDTAIIDGVTDEQQHAIQYISGHARLLAGPGTGKTHVLTRKVLWLVLKHNVAPENILALTFTRLAAAHASA